MHPLPQSISAVKTSSLFEEIQALVAPELNQVNRLILTHLNHHLPIITRIAQHLIAAGGKRIRPLVALLSTKFFNYKGPHHIALAAAVEYIHSATLLHDDVVDNSTKRRGAASANEVWGNKAPILVGDFLFSFAFDLMVDCNNLKVLKILSEASMKITQGELLQLRQSQNLAMTKEAYFDIISGKTAALFEAACEVGPALTPTCERFRSPMKRFGFELGCLFQIMDDLLDYGIGTSSLGKPLGKDFEEGKVTLPIIIAFARGTPKERDFWTKAMEGKTRSVAQFQQAASLLKEHDVIPTILHLAQAHATRAHQLLQDIPPSPAKKGLELLVQFSLNRTC